MKRDTWFLFAILAVLATVFALRGFGGPAATPGVFSDEYTLEQARAVSAETGKPILALATADWCPPCQSLKRGALSDPDVVAYLRENTVPVYIEESSGIEAIRELRVKRYPTTVVLNGEAVLGVVEGGASSEKYLGLIKQAVEQAG